MEKKNNQPIRILQGFKRKKDIFYYIYKADEMDYVLLTDYSRFANHIGISHKGVFQLEDIRFSVEKEDSQSFVSTLESYGIQYNIEALNKWAYRRDINLSDKEQIELWLSDTDDSEIPF